MMTQHHSDDQKLLKLLRVKKLESPGDAYFDAFLAEFHRYQRAGLMREPSVWERLMEAVRCWTLRSVFRTWALALAGASCALLAVGAWWSLLRQEPPIEAPSTVASSQTHQAGEGVQFVDAGGLWREPNLEFSEVGRHPSADEALPTHFVVGATSDRYDQTLAF